MWAQGKFCPLALQRKKGSGMKVKPTYPVTEWLGECHQCGESNLAEKFGDAIVEGKPVCVACLRNPRATERSEGARTSDSASAVAP